MKHLHRLFTALVIFSVVLGLFSMPAFNNGSVASAQEEDPEVAPLYAAKAGWALPGQYIVVLKDEIGEVQASAAVAETSAQGADIQFVYTSALKGFAAQLTPEMVAFLRSDPRVEFIEEDQIVSVEDDEGPVRQDFQPSAPWGLDRIDQKVGTNGTFYYPSTAGAGVHVYVIDSGIRTTHNEFGGRATLDFDTVQDGNNGLPGCSDHGTHVAGTIGGSTYGVAKKATLHGVRVLDCDGRGSISWVIAGIDWVKANHIKPAVANMSLGGGKSPAEDNALKAAIASGVTFVVAAGNENINACETSPARVPAAVTVGAIDNTDTRAYFSNYGSCVDIFAPGVGIESAVNTSDSATGVKEGTSMAAPHVTGAAALYLAGNSAAKPAVLASFLIAKSTKDLVKNPTGTPNRLLFIDNTVGAAPLLASPATKALTGGTPTLAWNGVYFANTYQLQYASDARFDTGVIVNNLSDSTYTFTTPLPDGKWYWRASGVGAYGAVGPWSASRYFTVDTTGPTSPTPKSPAAGTTFIGTPTFSWGAVKDAKGYEFSYTGDGNYTFELTKTSHKPPTMPKGNYTWSVRARDAAGNWGGWSGGYAIQIDAPPPATPILLTPTNYFTNGVTPTLEWKDAAYAVDYHIQIDTTPAFDVPLVQEESDVASTSLTTDTLTEGKYYWRVQAQNANNVYGKWSAVRYFTVDITPPAAPELKSPVTGATVKGTPTFTWNKPANETGIMRYEITVDIAPTYLSAPLTSLAHKPAVPFEGSGTWTVRAIDAAGNVSGWSASNTITITPTTPAKPIPETPNSGFETDETKINLTWLAAAYGTTYDIQIDDVASFTSPNYTYEDISGTSHTTGTVDPGRWYWRVRAKNSNGIPGPWSKSLYFIILSSFDSQFGTPGSLGGWEKHLGSAWNVASGYLLTNTLSNGYTSSASYPVSATNFTYEARMRMGYNASEEFSNGNYGLVVRGTPLFDKQNDWKNAYYFTVNQYNNNNSTPADASDDDMEACYDVWKITNGKWQRLTPYEDEWCSGVIKFNDWNTLKVVAAENDLRFYINGNLMWSQKVSGGPLSGRLGVFARYYGTDKLTTPLQVDWATASKPVITSLDEQVTPGQWTSNHPPFPH